MSNLSIQSIYGILRLSKFEPPVLNIGVLPRLPRLNGLEYKGLAPSGLPVIERNRRCILYGVCKTTSRPTSTRTGPYENRNRRPTLSVATELRRCSYYRSEEHTSELQSQFHL